MKKIGKIIFFISIASVTLLLGFLTALLFHKEGRLDVVSNKQDYKLKRMQKIRQSISAELGSQFQMNKYPQEATLIIDEKPQKVILEYTFDLQIQKEANKLLNHYKPDYGAIVVMDAVTGRILALESFNKDDSLEEKKALENLKESEEIENPEDFKKSDILIPPPKNLALRGTFPAASIFKIITAAAAVDKYHVSPETIISFNGGNHTLYKRNVLSSQVNRWTRVMTLKEAFARSINTVFGRLTFEKMEPIDINEYATRFGFNRSILTDIPFDQGYTEIPKEKNYELAEVVSGYNRLTKMSPLQGAMIAAAVAAQGAMPLPYLVEKLINDKQEIVFSAEPLVDQQVMYEESAEEVQILMQETILTGTSRKAFRPLIKDKKFGELELGGKTGSLWGDNPKGKVDWFVGYAFGEGKEKLAIAAITVNKDKWAVKAAFLAQSVIKKFFEYQVKSLSPSRSQIQTKPQVRSQPQSENEKLFQAINLESKRQN